MSDEKRPTVAELTDNELIQVAFDYGHYLIPADVRREIIRRDLNPVTSRTWEAIFVLEGEEPYAELIDPHNDDPEFVLMTAAHNAGQWDALTKIVEYKVEPDLRRVTLRLA